MKNIRVETGKHNEGFVRVEISPEMLATAMAKANEMGELNNSIRNGKGNLVGFLGEEVVKALLVDSVAHNTYQHDITWDGITFEVKTKDRTVDPLHHFDVSVAQYNTSQKADFYIFVSVFRRKSDDVYTHAHVLGFISKEEYYQKARAYKKGDVDPNDPRFTFRASCL